MPLTLPTPFSALIFDCDGTLVDTAPAHFHAVSRALATQGHRMDEDWYMARVGLTPDALLDQHERAAAEFTNPTAPLDRDAVYSTYSQHFHAGLELLREVAAVAAIAREWHGRVPMAVASNGQLPNVTASLRVTGLLPLFPTIVSADDVAQGKPAPDVFLEAARRLGVPPADCIVLEDSDEGLHAAHAAGMRSVDVRLATATSHAPEGDARGAPLYHEGEAAGG